jgi:ATP-dependent Lhr-like helicase
MVLAALWDLVWAGEVTNDTLAPLRALLSRRARARRGKPRPGGLRRAGPPAAAGRWSLLASLLDPTPSPTEAAHARALQLLERHGVLTREAVLAEGVPGGFAGVYGVLKAMEESGKVRRGYFVAGLGAAQFALPGAVDRLRDLREPRGGAGEPSPTLALAATDPAQPYGAALPWPDSAGRPARVAGAYVVLSGGAAAAFLERGGRSLTTFPGPEEDGAWVDALVALVKDGRVGKLEIQRIDGQPGHGSALADRLREAGFADGYRGLTLRR